MKNANHTPGPWVRKGAMVWSDQGRGWGIGCPDTPSAQALLVQLNSHAALLAALRAQTCNTCTAEESDLDVCDACRLKRAAIALAEKD